MPLTLSLTERLARARCDLRLGLPVVLIGQGQAMLCAAIEVLSPQRLGEMRGFGAGEVALTARRAETLKLPAYDGDLVRISLPYDADCRWLRALADPADDLAHPMKGPLTALRDADAGLHRTAIALAKEAQLLPAVLLVPVPDGQNLAKAAHLSVLTLAEAAALGRLAPLSSVISARLPMAASSAGRVHIFRPDDGGVEHYAIEIGKPDRDSSVLTRLHSACFTGDVLGSLKCDCGPQLRSALAQMGTLGAGVLLYLNQEGRGIGLVNKMRAYSLQDQGFDTVEANHRLGFEDDERDFRIGAEILRKMGFGAVQLMTNNPKKVDMLTRCGIDVTARVPLRVGEGDLNRAYLATKAAKSGHLL